MRIGLKNKEAVASKPKKVWEPMPDGKYLVTMNRWEIKETKRKDGAYLDCAFKVADGAHKDRLIWTKFILELENKPKAIEIGKRDLKNFLTSVGVEFTNDYGVNEFVESEDSGDKLDAIAGKVFVADVVIEEGQGGYAPKNKIIRFYKQ